MNTSYQKTTAETPRDDLPIRDRWEIPPDDRRKVIESLIQLCTERKSDNSLKRSSRTVIAALRLVVSFDRLSLEDRKLRTPPAPRPSPQPQPPLRLHFRSMRPKRRGPWSWPPPSSRCGDTTPTPLRHRG